MSPAKRQRGFTLAELIVAFTIAAIALVLLLRIAGTASRGMATADSYAEATLIGESILDQLAKGAIESGTSGSAGYFRWHAVANPAQPAADALLVLQNVRAEISWRRGSKDHRLTLEKLVPDTAR